MQPEFSAPTIVVALAAVVFPLAAAANDAAGGTREPERLAA